MADRTRILFFFLLAWLAVIMLRMAYLGSGMSGRYRIASETVAGRTYLLPALRGSIYDAENRKLAWSEKHYDLVIQGTITSEEADELRSILGKRDVPDDMAIGFVIASLNSDELMSVEKLVRSTPGLHINSRLERVYINIPEIREKIGSVNPESGRGVSGWEKEYDAVLAGKNGSFYVVRDRKGRWLKDTGTIKVMPMPGRDVHVPFCVNGMNSAEISK